MGKSITLLCLIPALGGCYGTLAPSVSQQVYRHNEDGVALLVRQNYAGAQRQFEEALRLDPDEPTTHYNLGNAAHHGGDWALAEQHYQACLQRQPDHGSCRHGLALLRLQQNRASEAWQMIEAWKNDRPQLADAQAEYGWLLRENGDLPAAQVQLQKALEMDPGNVRALTEMAIVYETHSYPERARSLYQRALQRDPNQPEVIARLARLPHRPVVATPAARTPRRPAAPREASQRAENPATPERD